MIAQQTLSLVDCLPQPNGDYTLRSEPISKCYDPKWYATFMPLIIASVFVYFGILVSVNIWLGRHKEDLMKQESVVFRALNGWYL